MAFSYAVFKWLLGLQMSLLQMSLLPITYAFAYGLEGMSNRVHERMLTITHAMEDIIGFSVIKYFITIIINTSFFF